MRHNQAEFAHTPVMFREVLAHIAEVIHTGDHTVVDCTLGEGGHSRMILEQFPQAKLISFERDPEIFEIAKKRLAPYGDRVRCVNANFSAIGSHLSGYEGRISAILYDFGISSFHYDRSGRGFTYAGDEPLDMRLDPSCEMDAAYVVNRYPFEKLAHVIGTYGEERFAGRIARRICEERERSPIQTVGRLADIIMAAVPKRPGEKERIHPATRSFQGLRIEVNSELSAIETSLNVSWQYLAPGGRIMAISFHSLEDRIAKTVFRALERGCACERNDLCNCVRVPKVKILTKKPVEPTAEEIADNRRSRSAKLRVVERI
ncbi:MAG: 16S rRNA (cytosine(1402)-N(4))-methyltransferase RsmH [Spirochaetota bacterium]